LFEATPLTALKVTRLGRVAGLPVVNPVRVFTWGFRLAILTIAVPAWDNVRRKFFVSARLAPSLLRLRQGALGGS
jgi:hypothetical protein